MDRLSSHREELPESLSEFRIFSPDEFTQADKDEIKKIIGNFNHRLQELSGFVIFDEQNHYRVDLPEGWKQMPGVKADTAVPIETH
jgi:hypothetical protein